jgi:hypothetical protein
MKEWLLNVGLAALAVLAPIQTVLITVGGLVFADFFTGVWAALKEKQPITSAALRRTVSKIIVYQIAVISGFVLEKYLLADAVPVAKLIAGTIGLVEVKSVLENTKRITGQDIFKDLVGKLGSKNDQP